MCAVVAWWAKLILFDFLSERAVPPGLTRRADGRIGIAWTEKELSFDDGFTELVMACVGGRGTGMQGAELALGRRSCIGLRVAQVPKLSLFAALEPLFCRTVSNCWTMECCRADGGREEARDGGEGSFVL